jgi:hypothetical protein
MQFGVEVQLIWNGGDTVDGRHVRREIGGTFTGL